MKWHDRIAKEMKIKHSDTVAVVRWGRLAKKATRKRNRRNGKQNLRKYV